MKRAFDIVFSACVLILLAPLFLIIGIIVKCTSDGPIFYTSKRAGLHGKPIHCLKFRSMYQDAEARLDALLKSNSEYQKEWDAYQKLKNDPRIIPIGRILRRFSIDELPQFWNVLKGDLSVVGPRPPTLMSNSLDEIEKLYGDKTRVILSVRPGITGIWQISGRSNITFEERCAIEERYAKTHTLLQDLSIIAKTIPAVLSAKGAF
ncbi:MAG TPA: sugar transferase [Chlamydiales bacterium]|nr:sugar transferase [Chlamydiales bacterium]